MKKALIVIDLINEIVHPDGKLAAKWYGEFVAANNIIESTNEEIQKFRKNGDEIIFVKVQFCRDYWDQPKKSPLFGKAHAFWVLQEWSWGAEFHSDLEVGDDDVIISKNRVSAFYNTALYEYLKQNEIGCLYFAGCATDLAIESAVRDAHDRDFECYVLANCCAATDRETHEYSLTNLAKVSIIL